ncbi:hypothetical protein SAMN00120144_3067 [Hymenobacter roseosalivarius DSM 11622]|uniref:Uncharacterized protein n=1 Tax=Hymenobacter roseosalivarius DSM 11622 TaxID=645990 RepID=A0A1W1W500_9BACT|nr:hypothetical protein [Hymenobacter roseosalivarius]SMC00687.1 hypothetical protein SAMN00120144_3067 [Hymenobacter roseosalivarius DSM 11622]
MPKTFKNLPRPGEHPAPKPTSERDFFDLSDDREPVKKAAESPKTVSSIGNTSNTSNTSNTGNIAKPDSVVSPAAVPAAASAAPDGVRQTFVLSRGHLEQLRDYVHARRVQGEYTYSQKQALQEALDLLFAGAAPAPPRPAQAREQEQQRRQRIQQGRQASTGK